MALGRRAGEQQAMWVATTELARSPGHPFYDALNRLLRDAEFDRRVEALCEPYYAKCGRPSVPPGVYYRMLFIGYFEGIDSQRGIAWRCADSLSLRDFLGIAPTSRTPEHSTLTLIRQRLPIEVDEQVFQIVLALAAGEGLVDGRTIGVDATLLEANAAMKTIVRKGTREDWRAFVTRLAKEQGVEIKDDDDLRRFDKTRKGKKTSNEEWESSSDPDSRIMRMKDGTTHLSYKVEHAVDLATGIVVAATAHAGSAADGETLKESVLTAQINVEAAAEDAVVEEIVADKGYHKAETLAQMAEWEVRTYVPERRAKHDRRWTDKPESHKDAVYANRRRVRGARSAALQRLRSEKVERTFAHACETGGGRRMWLRGLANVHRWHLVRIAGLNLGVILRARIGRGTPRGLADLSAALSTLQDALERRLDAVRNLVASIVVPRVAVIVAVDSNSRGCRAA
jgi:transposase